MKKLILTVLMSSLPSFAFAQYHEATCTPTGAQVEIALAKAQLIMAQEFNRDLKARGADLTALIKGGYFDASNPRFAVNPANQIYSDYSTGIYVALLNNGKDDGTYLGSDEVRFIMPTGEPHDSNSSFDQLGRLIGCQIVMGTGSSYDRGIQLRNDKTNYVLASRAYDFFKGRVLVRYSAN